MNDSQQAQSLAILVRQLNAAGHNPATSGNYSLRSLALPGYALVSESGIDKSLFEAQNLIPIEINTGRAHPSLGHGRRSSDETALHLVLYRLTPAGAVLHSHHLDSLLFADLYPGKTVLRLGGLELLKGFKGIKSHEEEIELPALENSQDMAVLALEVQTALNLYPSTWGFLLRGHGLYVWGESLAEAKRHLEVFEYVFKYHVHQKR